MAPRVNALTLSAFLARASLRSGNSSRFVKTTCLDGPSCEQEWFALECVMPICLLAFDRPSCPSVAVAPWRAISDHSREACL